MKPNTPTLNKAILEAYQNTIYRTFEPRLGITIGAIDEALTVFLFDNNASSWAFVSACNPYSIKISKLENQKRTQLLADVITNSNLRFIAGEGSSIDGKWVEESFLILDISKRDAIVLAQEFDQNALVFGYFNQPAELVICR